MNRFMPGDDDVQLAAIKVANPQAIVCILGGHGIAAWGDSSDEAEERSLRIIRTAEPYIAGRTATLVEHPLARIQQKPSRRSLPWSTARSRSGRSSSRCCARSR
jgi:rhamnose utilization protein RhaD (predicted bifunctional aldolase and dehydrogenase)